MYDLLRRFRGKLQSGQTVYGVFMKTSDPAFVEIAGFTGFDFAVLDMEHGPVSLEQMMNMIRAAVSTGLFPVVRVRDAEGATILQVLDIGALGVQVPQVNSAATAGDVVSAAKYHPMGERGLCRYTRAAKYTSLNKDEYLHVANDTLVIAHLEGVEGLENLDEILEVEGIDVLFIGPYDLSQSLGIPGEVTHPEVLKTMDAVVRKAKERGKIVGTFTDIPEMAKKWKGAGIQYLTYSVDTGLFTDKCMEILSTIKKQ